MDAKSIEYFGFQNKQAMITLQEMAVMNSINRKSLVKTPIKNFK